MEGGEAGAPRESIEVSEGEGASENANMQDDEKSSRDDSVQAQEDSNFEPQGASGEKLTEPEVSISQNPLENMDANEGNAPMLTPEKFKPEFEDSREILVSNKETQDLGENFLDHKSTPHATVYKKETSATKDVDDSLQDSIECRSFLESDDYSESAPTDDVSEMSTSVKNWSKVDDEGATPQFDEKKETLGKESEDVVMEIAERLSQLRSIGKTAESARKYILESDTGMEESDADDHISDLLGPKRLDFEVIDFDQFGAQPPDLPLSENLMKVNQYGGIGTRNGGKGAGTSTEAKKPEHHIRVLVASNGIEQEMKGSYDSPMKTSSKNTVEKKQLWKERGPERGAGALDLPKDHVIPRLCNMVKFKEGSKGHDISRDLDSKLTAGRSGNSKLRPPDSLKPKKISEAPPGSPIRRSKSTTPDVRGSFVHEETRKRTEELHQLTQMQAKRLEDCCNRVDLSTSQLEEQSRMHEELNRRLEAECSERLKSEAKLMVLCEMLPNVEETLKNLCDQVLFMEVQLQEQVDLRIKLEEDLEQERQERMHFVAKLEEQVDLSNKLEEDLGQERQERMHLAAKLEDQVGLRNKLEEDLEQERKERTQYIAQLEEQTRLHEEFAHKLEEERDERLRSEAGLMVLREMLPNMEEKLEDLNNQVESLVGLLQEQTELRKELDEKLDQECKERMQHMTKMEDQAQMHEELAHKLVEERDERLKCETNLKELRERLPNEEEKVKDLQKQIMSLATQLQEQIELRKELEERLDQEREERIQNAVIVSNHTSESLPVSSIPWSEEKIEFAKMLDEHKTLLANQVKEAEMIKNATEKKVGLLNHQVQNLEVLSEIAGIMEYVFSVKERAIRQALWTLFQALCLGVGLMNFILSYRNPMQSFLQPT